MSNLNKKNSQAASRQGRYSDHRLTPRKLSWLLRHSVDVAEHMDPDGFVPFDILQQISGAGLEQIQEAITKDSKGRYEVRDDEVRAVNGHSVHFCQNYEILPQPPEYLYHATNNKALPLIMAGALKKMGRHYIHMYEKPPQKTSVRYRILKIKPPSGHVFFRTKNGYILCQDDIPAEFIEVVS
ncbi:probable RNA 2'-phosphotransferase [Malaya genurostris]|uniref:probable RNA 2'-phosphotransferase n=1 Tax=Malaya genurostris TaxID=325434 RepID=UPI0026F38AEF|nr:probable RNA 2'-phosphotransferase [Malaya genurostris]XP_058460535.1 probable RNA 2'-phosphotransferase [Malaya genurostris]XP_058460545.1 probable RNA 2'-phosphotransferase [Malaya genurostris]